MKTSILSIFTLPFTLVGTLPHPTPHITDPVGIIKFGSSSASASSLNGVNAGDPPNNPPGVYVCSDIEWSGLCFWQAISPAYYGFCGGVTTTSGFNAFGPDQGITVDLFRDTACTEKMNSEALVWPGCSDCSDWGLDGGGLRNFGIVIKSDDNY